MPFEKPVDYAKLHYRNHASYLRYKRRVEAMAKKLICQECGGSGEYEDDYIPEVGGIYYSCGFCLGTGLLTPYLRGMWLKYKREEKRKQGAREVCHV